MGRLPYDVLAVGDAILDLVTPPLPPGPPGDRQSHVGGFSFLPGGNATNFALAFAALGGRARFVGCVGRDWAGDRLREAYRRSRVDARLRTSTSKATGMTIAVTSVDASRHLITALGANADLRLAHVPASWIAGARNVHRAGYWWATGMIGAPTARLLARAQKGGATTSFDVATDPSGWTASNREGVLAALPHVDVFFGTEEEIEGVAGAATLEAAVDEFLRSGVREVVVHQGARGSSLFARDGTASARAYPVAVANPTGCGDVFNAAYTLASLTDASWRSRLEFANAAAAWHLERVDKPYPTAQDVRERFRIRR